MKKAFQFMQLLGEDGRLNVPILLLLAWSLRVLIMREVTFFEVCIGGYFIGNYQADRFFKSRDVYVLGEKERKRVEDMEGQLANISAHIAIGSQRTMF